MSKSRLLMWTLLLLAAVSLLVWRRWAPPAPNSTAPGASSGADSSSSSGEASPGAVDSANPSSPAGRQRDAPVFSPLDRRRSSAPRLTPYGLDGLVIDPDRNPIWQARIEIQAQSSEAGVAGPKEEKWTGRDGSFYLRLAQPGRVKLTISAEGYARRELEVALSVPGLVQRVVALSPADSQIEGRVIDAFSQEPISDAVVETVYEFSFEGGARQESLQTLSDSQGHFHFGPLPAGSIQVTAAQTGFFEDVQHLGLAQGESEKVVLRLVPAETRQFTVTDPEGTPIGGAHVVRPDGWTILAGEDGRFRLPLIAELRFLRMTISARGFLAHTVKQPVAEVPDVIVLTPGPVLQGRVQDRWGRGIEGAEVTVLKPGGHQPEIDGQVLTDSDGRFSWALSQFELDGLEIRKDGYVNKTHRFASRQLPSDLVEIELRRGDAALLLRLSREERPVGRAYVHLRQVEGPDRGTSWKHVLEDEAGEIFISDLSSGVYTVSVMSPEREAQSFRIWRGEARIALAPNRLASMSIRLSPDRFVDIGTMLAPPKNPRVLPSR